jgi:hypothetical protein
MLQLATPARTAAYGLSLVGRLRAAALVEP